MTSEHRLPPGFIERDGIEASTGYIGPIPSDDDSPAKLEISRLLGNGDWKIQAVGAEQYMLPLRFTTHAGSDDSLFVGDELHAMIDKFLDKPTIPTPDSNNDNVYSPEATYKEGGEEDDFTLEVTGLSGLADIGGFMDHVDRFLDIRVNKDGSVVVTIRNRVGLRQYQYDELRDQGKTVDLSSFPTHSATVRFNKDGKLALFNETFTNIAVKAADALKRQEQRKPKTRKRK